MRAAGETGMRAAASPAAAVGAGRIGVAVRSGSCKRGVVVDTGLGTACGDAVPSGAGLLPSSVGTHPETKRAIQKAWSKRDTGAC